MYGEGTYDGNTENQCLLLTNQGVWLYLHLYLWCCQSGVSSLCSGDYYIALTNYCGDQFLLFSSPYTAQ